MVAGEIGWGGVVERFVAEGQNLVLHTLYDGEPVKGFQQGSDVLRFLLSEHQAGSVVLDTLEGVGGGVREAGDMRSQNF